MAQPAPAESYYIPNISVDRVGAISVIGEDDPEHEPGVYRHASRDATYHPMTAGRMTQGHGVLAWFPQAAWRLDWASWSWQSLPCHRSDVFLRCNLKTSGRRHALTGIWMATARRTGATRPS